VNFVLNALPENEGMLWGRAEERRGGRGPGALKLTLLNLI